MQNDVEKTKEVKKRIDEIENTKKRQTRHLLLLLCRLMHFFSDCLKKKGDKLQFKHFLDMLKQLQINISFVDVLKLIPFYVKFLKDILAKKKRLNVYETMALIGETRDVFKKGFVEKMKNSGSFTFPCPIGSIDLCRHYVALEKYKPDAAFIFKKMGIGTRKPNNYSALFGY